MQVEYSGAAEVVTDLDGSTEGWVPTMASHLSTISFGRFDVARSHAGGIPAYVAVDPTRLAVAPMLAGLPEISTIFSQIDGAAGRRTPVTS